MSTLTDYKRMNVVTPDPTGSGGLAINNNFKSLADRFGDLQTTDPTASNDNTQGFAVGSRWFNTSTNTEWVCTNDATGAAVWKAISSQWTTSGTTISYSGGNVGIGTSSPLATLEVSGNTAITGALGVGTVNSTVGIVDLNRTQYPSYLLREAGTALGSFRGDGADGVIGLANAAGQFFLTLKTSSGKIGIGVVVPSTFLHVVGTSEQLRLAYDATNYLSTTISSSGVTTWNVISGASFAWNVAGTAKMSLSTAGTLNVVAIDTVSSASVLNIKGSAISTASGGVTIFGSSGITNTTGNFAGLSILPTYNQASGSGTNTDLLVNRTETAKSSGAQYLADFQVGGTTKSHISNTGAAYFAGNVGIGTTSPAVALDVTGDASARTMIAKPQSSAPSSPTAGQIYYDSGTNHFYGWNGTAWKQLDN